MQAPVSDAELLALHHGRLVPERARQIELRIAREAETAARYQRLESEIAALTGVLSGTLTVPARSSTVALIKSAVRVADGGVPPWRRRMPRRVLPAWQAIAASLILAFGAAGGFGLSEWIGGDRALAQAMALQAARQESRHAALEFVASGSAEQRVADNQEWMVEVTPIRTFRNADGAFCREFIEIWQFEGATNGEVGVACRQQEGGWRNVASVAMR
jgi:anti-sigma factor RsiW